MTAIDDDRLLAQVTYLDEIRAMPIDAALDSLCEKIHDWLCAGQLFPCDVLLMAFDAERDAVELIAGALTFTVPARGALPSRAPLVDAFEKRLRAIDTPEECDAMFRCLR